MKIFYSPKFGRQYKKLPKPIQLLAEKREKIFRKNPFQPTLKTHKLGGKLEEFWSFSIDFKYRIIFEFMPDKTVHFHSVGDHDIYN
jgi:mRNA-degrading endonuclease YafQ of YafQ-DinJ toxin-antitoxin module